MPCYKAILFFLSCFFSCIMAFAQIHQFENYTTENGLLSDDVYSLHQDKKGYIWLFTRFGAQKFNGSEFRPVLKNLPFAESFMYSVYEAPNGNMWAANSRARIYEIKNDSAFLVKGLDTVSTHLSKAVAEIYQLQVDDSLNIYIGTKHYCYKLQKRRNDFKLTDLRSLIKTDDINYKVIEKDGRFFTILNFPLKGIDGYLTNVTSVKMQIPLKNRDSVYTLKINRALGPARLKKTGNNFYFIFFNTLIKISAENKASYISFKSDIQNYTVDRAGHLWIACLNDGLYELDKNDSVAGHYFDNISVNDVCVDAYGGLWASTTGQGIFYCSDLNTLHFKETDLLGKPLSVIKKTGNALIIANTKGDIFTLEDKGFKILKETLPRSEPLDVIKMNDGFVTAYRNNVEMLLPNGKTNELKINNRTTYALKLYLLGKDTLITMLRKSLDYFVKNKFIKKISAEHKLFCCYNWQHALLLGTETGIQLLKGSMITEPAYLNASRGYPIQKAIPSSAGQLWFCSLGYGLFVLDSTNILKHLGTSTGLPSDFIYNIEFTSDKRIFLSTNKGLFVSDYKNDPAALSWENIYPEAVQAAILFNKKIYLAAKNRLVILDPSHIQNNFNYYFNFARVIINSNEVDSSRLRALAPGENNIEFDLDLLTYTKNPPKIFYRLSGPVSESGTTTAHQLKFNNLSPGRYTLTVAPMTSQGKQLKIAIPFVINPAFYQTALFNIIAFFLLVSVITLAVWLIFRNRKRRQDTKNKAENQILEYKLIALKAQINPHFISNCLSSIQNLIINNKLLQAANYVAMFGLLVRQILNFSSRSLITVEEELEIAMLYLELEQMRFQDKFSFKIEVDSSLETKELFVPALILNPIIENAIWHGISSLTEAEKGFVLVKVYTEDHQLILMINDNGHGQAATKHQVGNTRESKGIDLVEQRLRNINFLYHMDSARLTYNYSEKPGSNRTGTTARISLPNNIKPIINE